MYKILAEIIMNTFTKNAKGQLEQIKGRKKRKGWKKEEGKGGREGEMKGRTRRKLVKIEIQIIQNYVYNHVEKQEKLKNYPDMHCLSL